MLDDMRLLWQVGLMEAGRYLWDILQTFAYENERKSLRSKPGADLQGFKNFLIEYCVLRCFQLTVFYHLLYRQLPGFRISSGSPENPPRRCVIPSQDEQLKQHYP